MLMGRPLCEQTMSFYCDCSDKFPAEDGGGLEVAAASRLAGAAWWSTLHVRGE